MKRRLKALIDGTIYKLDSLKERLEDISYSLSPKPPPLPAHFECDFSKSWGHLELIHKNGSYLKPPPKS